MGPATRVMSLRDGTKKMEVGGLDARINMTDDADTIAKKIQKAKTDPEPLKERGKRIEGRPEAGKILSAVAALSG